MQAQTSRQEQGLLGMYDEITEENMEIREATTRYVDIACKDKATGNDFDFTGYTVQTFLKFGSQRQYIETIIIGSTVSYKIPASISKGAKSGIAETRIFKDGDVYEVLRINIKVAKAEKPDIVPSN